MLSEKKILNETKNHNPYRQTDTNLRILLLLFFFYSYRSIIMGIYTECRYNCYILYINGMYTEHKAFPH